MRGKNQLNNCFLDLKRAALWYYLNPKGRTHKIFLRHARKILSKQNVPLARKFLGEILKIEKEVSKSSARNIYLADKILTIGCLLKR